MYTKKILSPAEKLKDVLQNEEVGKIIYIIQQNSFPNTITYYKRTTVSENLHNDFDQEVLFKGFLNEEQIEESINAHLQRLNLLPKIIYIDGITKKVREARTEMETRGINTYYLVHKLTLDILYVSDKDFIVPRYYGNTPEQTIAEHFAEQQQKAKVQPEQTIVQEASGEDDKGKGKEKDTKRFTLSPSEQGNGDQSHPPISQSSYPDLNSDSDIFSPENGFTTTTDWGDSLLVYSPNQNQKKVMNQDFLLNNKQQKFSKSK
jgi:hypothetical protein